MKKATLCLLMVLMASCSWMIPDKDPMKELLLAQKTLTSTVDVLQELKDKKYLVGHDLQRAQKLVYVANSAINTWKDSVTEDKRLKMSINPRPDLSAVVFDALEKLEDITNKNGEKP